MVQVDGNKTVDIAKDTSLSANKIYAWADATEPKPTLVDLVTGTETKHVLD
jgi:hypothetical protein